MPRELSDTGIDNRDTENKSKPGEGDKGER